VAEAKAQKLPVIVSMANVAASGGYWVSTPADMIFAEPSTITGSIGIFGIVPSAEKALAKIGITSDGVKTTPLSGEPDVLGGVDPQFHRIAQSAIEKGYRDFLGRVALSRKKTPEQVDAIGQGRVWAGGTARQIGLVDRFGGMDEALAEAAKRSGLKAGEWHADYLEPEPSFLSSLFQSSAISHHQAAAPMDIFARSAWEQQMAWRRMGADLQSLGQATGAQARCLECGEIANTWTAPRGPQEQGWIAAMLKLLG
jgi:protease-4